jgi:hypothetical protein
VENEFCTLFDANYLPRGLVLYESLRRACAHFRLRVLCMDEQTKRVLDGLRLPGLATISLSEIEAHDAGLHAVKSHRSAVEYCWTATPALCRFILDREPGLRGITYLDADLMFFRDPAPLFAELGQDSIMLTPHRHEGAWLEHEKRYGIFNVQFMTFRRDQRGLAALDWWRERCLEWCFARAEDGKFGDQKYLDDWPERFDGVHVLLNPGGGLAPWNVGAHEVRSGASGEVLVDGGPLFFYHYHGLRLYRTATSLLGPYRRLPGERLAWATPHHPSPDELELVWEPYVRRLAEAIRTVRSLEPSYTPPLLGTGDLARRAVRKAVSHGLAGLASGVIRVSPGS